jgi:hypothetical protein
LPDAIAGQNKKVQKYEHVAKEKDTGSRQVKEKPPTSPERRNLFEPVAAALPGGKDRKSHLQCVQGFREISLSRQACQDKKRGLLRYPVAGPICKSRKGQ